jgi:uncharacterized membrane-anchored protein
MTRWRSALLAAALLCGALPAQAQGQASPDTAPPSLNQPGPISPEVRQAEKQAAWQAAMAGATRGPAEIALLDQARLALPNGMAFIPKPAASRLLSAYGNRPGSTLVGMVALPQEDAPWWVIINWVPDGYVKDDEAAKLDPDAILTSLREAAAEGNKERVQRGFPELELLGWTQPPAYDAATHRLTWSLRVKASDEDEADATLNFNTRALGRDGYFSVNLLTSPDRIGADRQVSAGLLSGLGYLDGKRYTDFDASTDHVAEYGLAALLGVVVAKKIGLLALAGLFLAKFAKVGLVAVLGLGAAARRMFRRTPRA